MATLTILGHKTDFQIKLKVDKFSEWIIGRPLPLYRYSDPVVIHGLIWKIFVKYQDDGESLGYYLDCDAGELSNNEDWSCRASYTLRLKSCNTSKADISVKFEHVFCDDVKVWGRPKFVKKTKGLLSENCSGKNDTVTFVAEISADFPTGIEVPPKFSFTVTPNFSFTSPENSGASDTLVVANTSLSVNKFMLASQSEFFRKLFFNDDFNEGKDQHFKITDPDVNLEDFKLMVELADPFKGKLVPQDEIDAILALADQYDLIYIKEKCEIAMESKECDKSVFGKVSLAHEYNMEAYKKAIIEGIQRADYAEFIKNHRDEFKAMDDDLKAELFEHSLSQN